MVRRWQTCPVQGAGFTKVTAEVGNHLGLSELDVARHPGVLFDGVSDTMLMKRRRETLPGRPKILTGARSAAMKFSHPLARCRRAVVITMGLSARSLRLLSSDHWLQDRRSIPQLPLEATCIRACGYGRRDASFTPLHHEAMVCRGSVPVLFAKQWSVGAV